MPSTLSESLVAAIIYPTKYNKEVCPCIKRLSPMTLTNPMESLALHLAILIGSACSISAFSCNRSDSSNSFFISRTVFSFNP